LSPKLGSQLTALAACALALFGCARRHGSESTGSSAAVENAVEAGGPQPHAAGKELYDRYCKLCHAADGSGYAADNAPSLVSQTFLESATDAFIAHGIRVGRPNTAMGAYGKVRGGPLDDAAIDAIVAYLRTKGPKPKPLAKIAVTGDAGRGLSVYDQSCKTCHGTAAQRGTALLLDNPELLASASPEFLRHAIVHGRPPTSMPAFEGKLTPGQIDDVLALLVSRSPVAPAPKVVNTTIPEDLPVVINPKGKPPEFTLRDDRFVSAEQVKRALDQKRRIVIVDARSPADWIQFRIPGAISLPYHDANRFGRIPNDGTWVVAYCACPHHASGEVVDGLRRLKYPHTAVLDEGILFWKDRGYQLEGEAVPKTPAPASSAKKPMAARKPAAAASAAPKPAP
jgi:cytochrome c oxidase cbb3-type subunit 3/ubiquinol-cytochrome c reductase cytochrome c subunit